MKQHAWSEILKEARYDKVVTDVSREIINLLKKGYTSHVLSAIIVPPGIPVKIDWLMATEKNMETGEVSIGADSGPDDILMTIFVSKNDEFKNYANELIIQLKDTLTHELEHVAQYWLKHKPMIPNMRKEPAPYKYLTSKHEVPAYVLGFYRQAKMKKVSLDVIFDSWLELYRKSNDLTDKEVESVKRIWTKWAKKNLPASKWS